MKILFIANRGEIGGAHIALENMIINLKKDNHDITVLTPNKKSKWYAFCNNNNLRCEYINYHEIGYAYNLPPLRKIIKYILLPLYYILNKKDFFVAKKINKRINIKDYDYIHTNTNRDNFGIVLSKIYDVKHIMHLREFDKEFFKIFYLKRKIYKYFSNNTYRFISVSDAIKDNYIKKGIDGNRIITIYDGIDNKQILKKKNYQSNGYFNIIMVSNICEEKGQIKLIDAISKIRNRKIVVDFYGTGSKEYINYLKKHISKLNLTDRISFKGYNDNIKNILHNYDLAVMCSKVDGFGLVTVEYMMAGVPILIPKTGANFEIVSENKNGFMFDYNNIDSMTKQIIFIMDNYEKAKKMAQNAEVYAIKKFSMKAFENSIKLLYERGMENNENQSY